MASDQPPTELVTSNTLVASAFVLVSPALLFYFFLAIPGWIVSEIGELNVYIFAIIVLAAATIAFLSYVEISPVRFAALGILGPYISILTPVAATTSGPLFPVFYYIPVIYSIGFIFGLVVHHHVIDYLIGPPPR